MGGIENYGADELYNVDDNWGDDYNDYKPKVSSVSPKAASLQLSGPKQNKHFMYVCFFDSVSVTPCTAVDRISTTVGAPNTIPSTITTRTTIRTNQLRMRRTCSWSRRRRQGRLCPCTRTTIPVATTGTTRTTSRHHGTRSSVQCSAEFIANRQASRSVNETDYRLNLYSSRPLLNYIDRTYLNYTR